MHHSHTRRCVVTAPDPGLTDLIAAALGDKIMHTNGSGDRNRAYAAHVALVVEQHTNGRITELEDGIMRAIHELIETRERAENAEATIARVEDAVRFAYSHRFDLDSTDIVGQGDPATGPNNFYNGVIYVSGKARAALEGES